MKKFLILILILMNVQSAYSAGYVGTLPDVESEFSYLRKEHSEKASAPYSVEELDKQNEQQLKPIPRDNDNYVDIIVKKDKNSNYINDVNNVIVILEKLRRCLNTDQSIQMFNAIVSNLIDNVEYIRTEYKEKPESNYLSYNKLIEISSKARSAANFRTQGLASAQYIPYTSTDNVYTKEALEQKLENLLNDVNDTIFILKNLE